MKRILILINIIALLLIWTSGSTAQNEPPDDFLNRVIIPPDMKVDEFYTFIQEAFGITLEEILEFRKKYTVGFIADLLNRAGMKCNWKTEDGLWELEATNIDKTEHHKFLFKPN